jgi:hypothetical protein
VIDIKKMMLVISLLSLFIISFSIKVNNSQNISVNVDVKKYVKLIDGCDVALKYWGEKDTYKKLFGGEGSYLNPVNALDPEQRENGYMVFWGDFIGVISNYDIKVHSYFKINQEVMQDEFYNDLAEGESDFIGWGNIEGAVAGIHPDYFEALREFDFKEKIYRVFHGLNPTQALPIVSGNSFVEGTTTSIENRGKLMILWFGMQIKFTDDNWWKVQAGENIKIGTIHVTVEAVDSF